MHSQTEPVPFSAETQLVLPSNCRRIWSSYLVNWLGGRLES